MSNSFSYEILETLNFILFQNLFMRYQGHKLLFLRNLIYSTNSKVISSETYPRKTADANWCFHWMVRTLPSCRITFEKDAKFICGGSKLPIFRSRPFGFFPIFQRIDAQKHERNFILLLTIEPIQRDINIARTYLQPHYGNGVFGNVYLSAGQH